MFNKILFRPLQSLFKGEFIFEILLDCGSPTPSGLLGAIAKVIPRNKLFSAPNGHAAMI